MTTTTDRATSGPRTSRRAAHPTTVLLLIAGAQLMVVLDATIVNIALPTMGDYFHKSQTSMTWALNAYTLAFGGLLLLGGRAGDILGRRRMFIIGLALFSIGSFLGGIATTFQFLLFGRVVQGIGGAIASPTALSLITTSFAEGKERNRAFGVYAAVSGAGAALGLLLGGILTEFFSWRWVLFVNVPIGVALMVGAFFYITESERHKGTADVVGALLSVVGMVSLVYGFIHAADRQNGGWGDPLTIFCLVAAVILLASFFLWEQHASDPMMPLRVIEDRNRGGAYLVMLIVGAGLFGMFYFVTYFVQQVIEFSALQTGFAFLPVAFVIGITSQFVAKLMPRVGPKNLILTGTVLLTAAMFWYSTVTASSGYWTTFLPGMIVMATGMGFIFVPLTSVAVARVEPTDAGVASAMLNVGQQVGGSIGLSVLATVAATSGSNYAGSHQAGLAAKLAQLPANVREPVGKLVSSASNGGTVDKKAINDLVASTPVDQRPALQSFLGEFTNFTHGTLAHASAMGFLTAGIFGLASIVAAAVLINLRKEDLPQELPEGVAVG
ncbi:MAG: MFS transporter [Actinomycetota bacterium]|nr:MFS transporter [Actinomycetota bacterium]